MDLRQTVRSALVRLVADPLWWPVPDAQRFHNRLLDETGDDARELVASIMTLHACDVVGRLPAAVITREEWDAVRRNQSHRLGLEVSLSPSLVSWALDSWALALSIIPPHVLEQPRPPALPRRTHGSEASAQPAWVRTRGAGLPFRSAQAGGVVRGPSVQGSAAAPGGVLLAKWGTAPIPAFGTTHWTQRLNLDRMTFVVIGLGILATIGVQALGMLGARARAKDEAVVERPPSSTNVARQGAAVVSAPVDSQPTVDPALPVAASAVTLDDARMGRAIVAEPPDTVRLDDNRVFLGEVRLLTDSHVYLIEQSSGLPYEFRLKVVRELATHTGRVLHFPGSALIADAPDPTFIALGVGGRYRVRRRIVSVQGSPSCQLGADAQRNAPETEELIGHEPGSPRFSMLSRPGVQGRLENDGRFATETVAGTKDGTRYQWRMEGRFTTTGFTAQSDATTEAMVGWRNVQECRFVTELTGERRR